MLAGSSDVTIDEPPSDKDAVCVVVAEGRDVARIDDRLLCDSTDDPAVSVCLG